MATKKPNISLITMKNLHPQVKPKSLGFNRDAYQSFHKNYCSNP